jgi:hypothetical protein
VHGYSIWPFEEIKIFNNGGGGQMVGLLGLWCLMPMPPTIMSQLYRGGKFYWWRKPEFQDITTPS